MAESIEERLDTLEGSMGTHLEFHVQLSEELGLISESLGHIEEGLKDLHQTVTENGDSFEVQVKGGRIHFSGSLHTVKLSAGIGGGAGLGIGGIVLFMKALGWM